MLAPGAHLGEYEVISPPGPALDARLKASCSIGATERHAFSQTTGALEHDGFSRATGLAVDESNAIARQMAEALQATHENGIIHRDPK